MRTFDEALRGVRDQGGPPALRVVGRRVRAPGAQDRPQPEPTDWTVWHLPGGLYTVIVRHWESARDVAACTLCPLADCFARRKQTTVCTVVAAGHVPDHSAPLFSPAPGFLRVWPHEGGR